MFYHCRRINLFHAFKPSIERDNLHIAVKIKLSYLLYLGLPLKRYELHHIPRAKYVWPFSSIYKS